MGLSKISYNGSEDIYSIQVQDGTGRKYEDWKFMKRDILKVLRILNNKHDWGLIIKDRKNRDLDWAL